MNMGCVEEQEQEEEEEMRRGNPGGRVVKLQVETGGHTGRRMRGFLRIWWQSAETEVITDYW